MGKYHQHCNEVNKILEWRRRVKDIKIHKMDACFWICLQLDEEFLSVGPTQEHNISNHKQWKNVTQNILTWISNKKKHKYPLYTWPVLGTISTERK